MRSKVTSKKLTVFLFASMVILRPFDLNTLVTRCFIFFYFSWHGFANSRHDKVLLDL